MNRKLIILVVVVAVVAIVAFVTAPLFSGAFNPPVVVNPPVDVYARPSPLISESPVDLFPNQVAGFDFLSAELGTLPDGGESANGTYEGGILITIFRHSSSGAASAGIDDAISFFEESSGSLTSVNAGDQHWFTFTGSGTSIFMWRKGVWIFGVAVSAFPALEALRNQVAEELLF